MARTLLTAPVTYYVSPAGSDSTGDGSAGNPWATPPHAADVIWDSLDLADLAGNGVVTVNIADGIAYPALNINGAPVGARGPQSIVFIGHPGSSISVQLAGLVSANDATFTVKSLSAPWVQVSNGYLNLDDYCALAASASQFDAAGPRSVLGLGRIYLYGSAPIGLLAEQGARVIANQFIDPIIPGISFSDAFAYADEGAEIDLTGCAFDQFGFGSAGKRWNVISNGIIRGAGALNPLLGSFDGTSDGHGVFC